MTWEQKVQAMKALGFVHLGMNQPGSWWVHCPVERVDGILLEGGCGGFGASPQDAVEKCWAWLTDPRFHVRVGSTSGRPSRYVRWNGFMWQDVKREAASA